MPRRAPRTILELAIAIGGYRKGMRVMVFIEQWTIAQQALGHEPTVNEAADWWKETRSLWFRRLDEFREIFDLLQYPTPLATAIIEHRQGRVAQGEALAELARMTIPQGVTA